MTADFSCINCHGAGVTSLAGLGPERRRLIILLGSTRSPNRPDASIADIMREQIGSCPHRNDTQLYTRCDPYWPMIGAGETKLEILQRRPGATGTAGAAAHAGLRSDPGWPA